MDCSPPGSSVHRISQVRILECTVISFSRGSPQSRDWTCVSCTIGRVFTTWAIWEVLQPHKRGLRKRNRKKGGIKIIWIIQDFFQNWRIWASGLKELHQTDERGSRVKRRTMKLHKLRDIEKLWERKILATWKKHPNPNVFEFKH